jgi:hypothetical protein
LCLSLLSSPSLPGLLGSSPLELLSPEASKHLKNNLKIYKYCIFFLKNIIYNFLLI